MNLEITDDQFSDLLSQARKSSSANKDFDLNLAEGLSGESELSTILETVEVKTDFLTNETGNVAVEYESRGKPSGISTTKAKYWAFKLVNMGVFILIETSKLKAICRQYYVENPDSAVVGGDDYTSMLILLPVGQLV
mgnify:FL=1|jgi:hypothetical protein